MNEILASNSVTSSFIEILTKRSSKQNARHEKSQIIVPLSSIVEIPGESNFGLYDLETGEPKVI